MARVQLEVDEDQRDSWDEFVDENGHVDSRADLIRLAVEKHISDTNNSGSESINDAALDSLHDEIAEIHESISVTQTQIRAHRQEAASEEDIEDITHHLLRDTVLRLTDADSVEISDDPDYGVVIHRNLGNMTHVEKSDTYPPDEAEETEQDLFFDYEEMLLGEKNDEESDAQE